MGDLPLSVERRERTGTWTPGAGRSYETFLSAVWEGHLRLVMYYFSQGVKISDFRHLAVVLAAARGNLDMLKLLISLGGDPHAQDDAPLIAAVNNGNLGAVRYLLSFGPDVSKHLHHAEEGTLVHELLLDSCGKTERYEFHSTNTLTRLVMSYY